MVATGALNGARPLLVSADGDLIDDVLRLAAANGVDVHLATDAEGARSRWQAAPLVMIGSDLAAPMAGVGLGRRRDVVLVTREPVPEDWQRAVALGAEHVVALPDGERWLIDRLADSTEGTARDGSVLAVMGCGGGAGASTFAATLALAAASASLRVLLVDADPLGGGLDVLLGIEEAPGIRWGDLADARGRLGAPALDQALPQVSGVSVLSWGRDGTSTVPADVVGSVVDAGVRGYDLVVVDAPRSLGPMTELVLARADRTLLVSVNHVRATSAAARLAGELELPVHVSGVGAPDRPQGRARGRRARRPGVARRRSGAVLRRPRRACRRGGSTVSSGRLRTRLRVGRGARRTAAGSRGVSAALVERVRARLVAHQGDATPARVAAALRAEGLVLGDAAILDLVGTLRQELVGAGPLDPLLLLPDVTDVLVNGPSQVWVDRGEGLSLTDVVFGTDADVRRLAQRLAASAGRRLDEASPFVDARLPDGTRLHCVIPPVAVEGTLISLRILRRGAFSLEDLVARGSLDADGAELLRAMVRARLAILISGGTGSGKTTILSTLLGLVDERERIVIVEDSTELSPTHRHAVRLQARMPNVEGAGVVTLRDLVRQALRMRPDRLVLGEVRGAEVVDLLAAMNTGHEGGMGTVHANSAADVPARLEALGLVAGLDRMAVHALVAAAVDVVMHLGRDDAGRRVVAGVHVLARDEAGLVHTTPAMTRRGGSLHSDVGMPRLTALLARG